MSPRLSVIITFYDETAFLPMAVRSILAQGLSGTEILIVNDNPAQFPASFFAALDLPSSVTVLHHPENRGLSAARNTGLAQARGTWVGFLDADDYFMADGLAAQLAMAEDSGADITHAPCCISHVGSPEVRPHPRDAVLFPAQHMGAGLTGFEAAQFITSSWSSLYRRAFLNDKALRFDDAQVKFEDRLFVLQTVTAARRIATLGRPVRVWRRRAGSISVTPPDAGIHRLQVQLLEKCMAHMRAHAGRDGIPPRFLRREVFNTVSRLIWDMDVVSALAANAPDIADLGPRIVALLGDDQFGQAIFDDPVIAQISRVGQKTRAGLVRRVDFFAIHKALREGDFAAAAAVMAARKGARAPAVLPQRKGAHLVLHLGMHKTGSTWLQRTLQANQATLRAAGVLFPKTGLADAGFEAVRPDGFPGHQGLLAALRRGQTGIVDDLMAEVRLARCKTVILSCENMLLPLEADRDTILETLFQALSGFGTVSVVAFARSPDTWAEMFYRELVCNAHRPGARSIDEFLVDYADRLTNLPGLFQPFEAFSGHSVALIDHDASAREGLHWQRFLMASGLAGRLPLHPPVLPSRLYPTPDRDQVQAARLICTMISQQDTRQAVMRGFFAADPGRGDPQALLSPGARLALVDRFEAQSARYAAARGYAPDLGALRAALRAEHWTAPGSLPADLIDRLHHARLQAERPLPAAGAAPVAPGIQIPPDRKGEITLRIRPRPWLTRLLRRR